MRVCGLGPVVVGCAYIWSVPCNCVCGRSIRRAFNAETPGQDQLCAVNVCQHLTHPFIHDKWSGLQIAFLKLMLKGAVFMWVGKASGGAIYAAEL